MTYPKLEPHGSVAELEPFSDAVHFSFDALFAREPSAVVEHEQLTARNPVSEQNGPVVHPSELSMSGMETDNWYDAVLLLGV